MNGYYEYHRDYLKLPDIWTLRNNTCMPHFHSCIEVTYVTKGTVQVWLNGASYSIHAEEVSVFPSYSVHSCRSDQPSECIVLTAPLDFLSSVSKTLSGKTFGRFLISASEATKEIYRCMKKMLTYCSCKKMNSPVVKGYCSVIIGLIIEQTGLSDAIENADDDLAKSILQFLQENFLSTVTLEDLASHFGYSKYRFSHLFNTYFHCSITEYVNSLRVRYAAGLLLETEHSMTEVAMASGFESIRTFNRAFRSYYLQSPTHFRESRGRGIENIL